MIITKLQGGLGNQMFQFAIAYSCNKKVYIDFSFLEKNNKSTSTFTAYDFELNIFPQLRYSKLSNFKSKFYSSKKKKYAFLRKIFNKPIEIVEQVENEFIQFDRNKPNIYFNGYFQSEKYFMHKKEEIIDCFSFPDLSNENKILKKSILSKQNAVSLHIRRGDYLKPEVIKYHGILTNDYYNEAIKTINDKVDNPHFFVFSNDVEYVRHLYGNNENFTIIDGNSKGAWQDMALMTHCKHHIIANSSFSWWGAWLSTKDGYKIAPKKWFNPEVVNFDINDFVPENWLKI